MKARAVLCLLGLLVASWPLAALSGQDDIHPDRLLARYKPQVDPLVAGRGLAPLGMKVHASLRRFPQLVVLETVPAGVDNNRSVAARRRDLRGRMEKLRASGLFEYVEPDYRLHARVAPTDSAFVSGVLWGLRNQGFYGGVPGADIQATNAWNITTGSTNVIVAVIDTGIRYTHHDLAAQMWHNPGEIAGNGADDDQDGYVDDVYGINAINGSGDPNDDNGHGTHVAGTIGAAANDGNPHVGVAWQVQLMACKFLTAEGEGYTSDAITCINYAVDKGARIINASWGGDSYSQALFDAIAAAGTHGVLFVAAAGNDAADNDTSPSYPCNYQLDNVISVAAMDRTDKLASFSNYGTNSVHLAAPGVDIYSCVNLSDTSYGVLSGTSMAAPHVAGAAALLLARYPSATALELRQRLLSTVTPASAYNLVQSGGRLNAYGALMAQSDGRLQVLISPASGSGVVAGQNVPVQARVTDLVGVTNATVVAVDAAGNNHSLLDNGVAPDAMAGDARYSGVLLAGTNGEAMNFTIVAAAPGKQTAVIPVSLPLLFPPVNDNFSNSLPLVGTHASVTGSNVSATKEAGEPDPIIFNSGGKSVWWRWQAPTNGCLRVNTHGSDFVTLLAVDLGSAVDNLAGIASDDNSGGDGSFVTLTVTNGLTYYITVDGWSGASGQIQLNLDFVPTPSAPANDNFLNRAVLSGFSDQANGSNVSATKELAEPNHDGNGGGHSVWWTWTAPASGTVQITTDGSDFETTLAVYSGTGLPTLTSVAADAFSGATRSLVTFPATAGSSYQIAVDGYDGAIGDIHLSLALQLPPPAPANDDFGNAIPLSGALVQTNGSNVGATKESGEPAHAGNSGGGSVWWRWTAPASGYLTADTVGSDFDTLLAIYTGNAVTNLTVMAGNNHDPLGGSGSRVALIATQGETYWIAVDGNNLGYGAAAGNIILNLSLGPLPSAVTNDFFANRSLLSGWTNALMAYSGNATTEPNEPEPANKPGGKSLWWSWAAPADGTVTIDTYGSDFDTLLAVYTGDSLAGLAPVASNDDSGTGLNSWVRFPIVAGTVYQIVVAGFRGSSGQIHLSLLAQPGAPPPANDNFAASLTISDLSQPITGSTLGATREPGEPAHLGQATGHSIWWNWTPTTNALVILQAAGSDFEPTLSVYTGTNLTALALVAADAGTLANGSQVSFLANAGQTYQIAVDGNNGAMGDLVLRPTLLPVLIPAITVEPQDRLANAGAIVAFTVTVSSVAPVTYQWRRDGVPLANDASRIFGADTGQLVLLDVRGSDAGAYSALASNAAGAVVSASAALRVNGPSQLTLYPPIQTEPKEIRLGIGGQAGAIYRLEASTNLINWFALGTFTNASGWQMFTDSVWSSVPSCFYRTAGSGQ